MRLLLRLSVLIDALNQRVGRAAIWLVLVVVLVSAGNAAMRYAFNWSSNGWLEIQWYLFSALFLLCAGYVLLHNEHIRIDILVGRLSPRGQNWVDVFGILVFLLPMAVLILALSWPAFANAWHSNETSPNPGGLVRWPVRLLMPMGFALLLLQSLSELVKRVAFLAGRGPNVLGKKKEPSAEETLAAAIREERLALEAPQGGVR